MHPDGEGSKVSNEELNISFDPTPDYSGIAKAAAGGDLYAARADLAGPEHLERVIKEAVDAVLVKGQSAVLDCKVSVP